MAVQIRAGSIGGPVARPVSVTFHDPAIENNGQNIPEYSVTISYCGNVQVKGLFGAFTLRYKAAVARSWVFQTVQYNI